MATFGRSAGRLNVAVLACCMVSATCKADTRPSGLPSRTPVTSLDTTLFNWLTLIRLHSDSFRRCAGHIRQEVSQMPAFFYKLVTSCNNTNSVKDSNINKNKPCRAHLLYKK